VTRPSDALRASEPPPDPANPPPTSGALRVQGPVVRDARTALTSRPARALLLLAALVALTDRLPGLGALSPLGSPWFRSEDDAAEPEPEDTIGEAELDLATETRGDLAQPETVRLPAAAGPIARSGPDEDLPRVDAERPPLSLVDADHSLDRFFVALARTAHKLPGATTRVLYYGDSMVASDLGTATLRRKLQAEFGDGGHGFVLVANAWPQYFRNDVYRLASTGFKVSRVVGPYQKDGLYGLGGVSFLAPTGVRSIIGTARSGTFGRAVSRFGVSYLEIPHGGTLRLSIDGGPETIVETRGEAPRTRLHEITVPDGPHELALRVTGRPARLFGFILERDAPGVVLDAVGLVGARVRFLDKMDDAHWAENLRLRQPNLVVYQFGANESSDGIAYPMSEYHRTMKEVILKVQQAVPEAGCLIVGAMDRARKEGPQLVTVPVIPLIVEEQRRVAADIGCAFFDTFRAMGGKGSMARWVRRGYGAGDFTHPTSVGAEVIGNWLYQALMERWEGYRTRAGSDR
jgi:lysophospholipase L1-like esterase